MGTPIHGYRSPMSQKVTALLIFHQTKPYHDVEAALERLAVPTERAQTLGEASHVLSRVNPPLLVFTESELTDGNWADVVSLSARASSPVCVIVVGQEIDTRLYASVIEVGAFDFIAPPFDALDLAHVVRCAAGNALARREAARNALTRPKGRQVPGYTENQL
jgi:DNA-binding NtrC family response regulator